MHTFKKVLYFIPTKAKIGNNKKVNSNINFIDIRENWRNNFKLTKGLHLECFQNKYFKKRENYQ